jgi:hypothetical protein
MTDVFEVINICNNYIIEDDYSESDDIYVKRQFEFIIIKDIKYKMWNIDRYYDNYKKISDTKTTIPIEVEYIKENKYKIIDGNHRCYVCNELGYKKIPAYVYYYKPPRKLKINEKN